MSWLACGIAEYKEKSNLTVAVEEDDIQDKPESLDH